MQIGLGITVPKMGILGGDAGVGLGVGFFPGNLFLTGAQGAWYDPSDFSTLFQNASGTTPVTAVEQPVRLMLDRSRGLVLGSELVVNGTFDANITGWTNASTGTGTATWSAGGASLVRIDAGNAGILRQSFTTVAGRSYRISYSAATAAIKGGVGTSALDDSLSNTSATAGTTTTAIFVASGTTTHVYFIPVANATTAVLDNVSVRDLPGNHALAPNDASRPILRARYNRVLHSEALTIANGWTTPFIANATRTDGALSITGSEGYVYIQQTNITIANASHMCSFDAVCDQTITNVPFRLSFGGGSVSLLVNMVAGVSQRITLPAFTTTATEAQLGIDARDAIVPGGSNATGYTVTINRISILTAADQSATGGAYQRIAAATDYDTSNPVWRPYLAFDGVDDHFTLASAINITTDMTVVRGFGRSAAGIHSIGLSDVSATVNVAGMWYNTNTSFVRLGNSLSSGYSSSTATGFYVDTAARNTANEYLRRNGAQIGTRSAPTVSGTLSGIGRWGPTDHNNGPIYGLIVLDRELTGSELTATEQWMAGKTGATL